MVIFWVRWLSCAHWSCTCAYHFPKDTSPLNAGVLGTRGYELYRKKSRAVMIGCSKAGVNYVCAIFQVFVDHSRSGHEKDLANIQHLLENYTRNLGIIRHHRTTKTTNLNKQFSLLYTRSLTKCNPNNSLDAVVATPPQQMQSQLYVATAFSLSSA